MVIAISRTKTALECQCNWKIKIVDISALRFIQNLKSACRSIRWLHDVKFPQSGGHENSVQGRKLGGKASNIHNECVRDLEIPWTNNLLAVNIQPKATRSVKGSLKNT